MEFRAAGCCTRKWLRLDQTIRNLTFSFGVKHSYNIIINPLQVEIINPSLTHITIWLLTKQTLFEGKGEKEQYDLVCVERLQMTGLMLAYVDVLILWGVDPILRNGMEFRGKEYVALL